VRRPKPHQLILAIGAFAAVATLASGVLPTITHWEDDSAVQRPVFINVPSAVKLAFYLVLATMLFLVSWLAAQRIRNYERGKPDDRSTTKTNVKRRLADFRAGVYMQTLLRDPAAGLMHSCIYFGFLGLFNRDRDPRDQPPAARLDPVLARRQPTRRIRPAPTSRASCSWSASSGRRRAATSSGPTGSESRPSLKTQ